MEGMDHSSIPHSATTNSTSKSDCCKTLNHCNSSSCSLAFFSQAFDLFLLSLNADANASYISTIPESFISPVFRPPIFC